jgi:dihydroflavonol-4-reductase
VQHVLVTGANGHVGFNLVNLLVERGYRVRAGVRGADDRAKTGPLRALRVELVEADLERPATLDAAAADMDGVFHVAAVFRMWAKDPNREIVDASVQGGLAMLRAAKAARVQKVVFTSSIAAVGVESPKGQCLTEDDWNTTAQHPYVVAKTEAEKAAWQYAEQSGLKMVAINPATILGPGFHRHTPSTQIVDRILRWRLPVAMPFGSCYVDVRDVALAHLLAYENPAAAGRYVVANGPFVTMAELMRLIHQTEPRVSDNPWNLPGWVLHGAVLGDWLGHVVLRRPRHFTRDMLREFARKHVAFSHAKATRELGWQPRDFAQCVADTVAWIRRMLPPAR